MRENITVTPILIYLNILILSFVYDGKYLFAHNTAIGVYYNNFSFRNSRRRGPLCPLDFQIYSINYCQESLEETERIDRVSLLAYGADRSLLYKNINNTKLKRKLREKLMSN